MWRCRAGEPNAQSSFFFLVVGHSSKSCAGIPLGPLLQQQGCLLGRPGEVEHPGEVGLPGEVGGLHPVEVGSVVPLLTEEGVVLLLREGELPLVQEGVLLLIAE